MGSEGVAKWRRRGRGWSDSFLNSGDYCGSFIHRIQETTIHKVPGFLSESAESCATIGQICGHTEFCSRNRKRIVLHPEPSWGHEFQKPRELNSKNFWLLGSNAKTRQLASNVRMFWEIAARNYRTFSRHWKIIQRHVGPFRLGHDICTFVTFSSFWFHFSFRSSHSEMYK